MSGGSDIIWFLELPEKYGEPPKKMSVSTLQEIESCPRRYALRRADYHKIWGGFGYPPALTLNTLRGTIIHAALETIIKVLRQVRCSSIADELFVKTMRSLNGYSGVLEKQLDNVSNELFANPRLKHKVGQIIDKLKNSLPALREQLQSQVSKLELNTEMIKTNSLNFGDKSWGLSNGIHSEVELNAIDIGWYGKIDYLKLSAETCEIADFKTGESKPEHIFQLKIYNMLWVFDEKQNPNSVPVSKLILFYKTGDFEIKPLSEHEINDFINEVKQRTASAKSQLLLSTPEARPSVDNCSYCSVRQLCSAYWTLDAQKSLNEEKILRSSSKKKNVIDIEIELESPIAEHIWYARVLICGKIESDTRLLVRFASISLQVPLTLKSGLRLRLLNVNLLEQTGEESSVLTISTIWQSEIFLNLI